MKLLSLNMPESRIELNDWLERHLVGLELSKIVSELQAINGATSGDVSLRELCGNELAGVFQSGLSQLSDGSLSKVLRHPRELLTLQEHIFIEGGDYWNHVETSQEHQASAARVLTRFQRHPEITPAATRGKRFGLSRRNWLVAAITTTVALISAIVWLQPDQNAPSWGWDRDGALAVDMTSEDYLNHLADGAQEWFKKRPDSPEGLVKRLRDFRHGCNTLIAAEHRPLSQTDRLWLVDRCRAWAEKIDGHVAALDGGASVDDIRKAADDTVTQLIEALRVRETQA